MGRIRCYCNQAMHRNTASEFGLDTSKNVRCSWCLARVAKDDMIGWCPNSGKTGGHTNDTIICCSACLHLHRVRALSWDKAGTTGIRAG